MRRTAEETETVFTSTIPVAQEIADESDNPLHGFSEHDRRRLKLGAIIAAAVAAGCLLFLWALMWIIANLGAGSGTTDNTPQDTVNAHAATSPQQVPGA